MDLLIAEWVVTGKIDKPDLLYICDPLLVPNFNVDSFPFVIVRELGDRAESKTIYLINIKDKTI